MQRFEKRIHDNLCAKCYETAKQVDGLGQNSDYGRLMVVIFENLEGRSRQLVFFRYQFFNHLPHLGIRLDALGSLQMCNSVGNSPRQLR